MHQHYRTQAIFLKKDDRGEADRIFTVFTRDFGKIEVNGRAIRKITSKLRAGAEIFYLSEIEFIQGKTRKTLTDVLVIEKFLILRTKLHRLRTAYQIAAMFDKLVRGEEKDERLWELLKETFERINDSLEFRVSRLIGGQASFVIYYSFFWNLLAILGYEPDLYYCSICRKQLAAGKLYLDINGGGLVCAACFTQHQFGNTLQLIKTDTIKLLRLFLKKDQVLLAKLKITSEHKADIKKFSDSYLATL